MICIVNVDDNPRSTGSHKYELRINRTVIGTFHHLREKPLSECLYAAFECAKVSEKEGGDMFAKSMYNYLESIVKGEQK